jgi:hypothetical protein
MVVAIVAFGLHASSRAQADAPAAVAASGTDSTAAFEVALGALRDGRPHDAVAQFEALADRGIVDPAASYDRGLAYVARVRSGVDVPGDLGQAAHAFEEAAELAADGALKADAARATALVRSEVARRRARSGETADIERRETLGWAVVHMLPERVWAWCAVLASVAMAAGFLLRERGRSLRSRLGAHVTLAFSVPFTVVFGALTYAARWERQHVVDGVVIALQARATDERGVAKPGGQTIPEAARVAVLEQRGAVLRIRWGSHEGWVLASTVRRIAVPRAD